MKGVHRVVVVLWGCVALLFCLMLWITLQGLKQYFTAPQGTGSLNFLVFSGFFLFSALVFTGITVWLSRNLPSSIPGSTLNHPFNPAKQFAEMQDAAEQQQQAIKDRVAHADELVAPNQEVQTRQWKNGESVTRSTYSFKSADPNAPAPSTEQIKAALGEQEKISAPYPTNVLASNDLTMRLALANKVDLNALQDNRAGRLTFTQRKKILGAVGLGIVFGLSILGFFIAISLGFEAIQYQEWLSAVVPCGLSIAFFAALGGLFGLLKRMGADEYLKSPGMLFLPVVDALKGNVKVEQGVTHREVTARESVDRDNQSSRQTQYEYYYMVNGLEINVPESGYDAFPAQELDCRVYYLPMSKTLVNIEVVS